MTDLERVELAARRASNRVFRSSPSLSYAGDLARALEMFADELLRLHMEKDPDGEDYQS